MKAINAIMLIVAFGALNLASAVYCGLKTNENNTTKKDMAQKSMVAIIFTLFVLLIPLGIMELYSLNKLDIGDFLFYILVCFFGFLSRKLCSLLFSFLDRSKVENYTAETSVILLIACLGISLLCFCVRGNEWGWAYLCVAIGRFLWLDSTYSELSESTQCFLKQLSWSGWYGATVVLYVFIAVILEFSFEIPVEYPFVGIAISGIGYMVLKPKRKECTQMTRKEFMKSHWAYYLMLEKKFVNTTMYVELSADNYATFSNEFASLLQLVGAELDSFFKVYCGYDPEAKKNIADYARYILAEYPDIKNQEIEIMGGEIVVKPFETWDGSKAKQSLPWWEAFDNIKHNRIGNQKDASLKNVLNILSALYLLEMKYLSKISTEQNVPDIPDEESSIFMLKDWTFRYVSMEDAVFQLIDGAVNLGGGGASDI